MPITVERCQRRRDYRIETDTLALPEISAWPLLDPRSIVLPERMCQLRMERHFAGETTTQAIEEKDVMPDVGPSFTATLVNIGGGGVGYKFQLAMGVAWVDTDCTGFDSHYPEQKVHHFVSQQN